VYLDTHVNVGERIIAVDRFKGDPNEYQDQPGGMLACASSVRSGIDLVPGDSIIMGYLNWLVRDIYQVGPRVRRAEMAPFTQVFRVVPPSQVVDEPACTLARHDLTRASQRRRGREDCRRCHYGATNLSYLASGREIYSSVKYRCFSALYLGVRVSYTYHE
jgi:hypothetical protein